MLKPRGCDAIGRLVRVSLDGAAKQGNATRKGGGDWVGARCLTQEAQTMDFSAGILRIHSREMRQIY